MSARDYSWLSAAIEFIYILQRQKKQIYINSIFFRNCAACFFSFFSEHSRIPRSTGIIKVSVDVCVCVCGHRGVNECGYF